MANKDLENKIKAIASKYDNMNLLDSSYDESKGQLTMKLSVNGSQQVSELPPGVEVVEERSIHDGVSGAAGPIYSKDYASRRRITLDPLSRDDLDLANTSIIDSSPSALYQRAIDYYRTKDVYGSSINVLTNFAAKGFENDIDDKNIKEFFDNWVVDTGFDDIVEKIFFDFFRVGMVRTYKVMGRYIPKTNHLNSDPTAPNLPKTNAANKETAAPGNRFTKTHIPIAYTILNPCSVLIKGSLMFGQTSIYLKRDACKDMKHLLECKPSELSKFQKDIISALPKQWKDAILKGDDVPLDPDLVGEIDYRRMPYERYPYPKGARAFEGVDFKDELRKADYSTLDGITNYILLIRVGNDNNPVKKQDTLDRASELFDTVSKSYKVVWNHTMDVEKITSPEIGEILGQDKYRQVNGDITGALGIVRALIDGLGESNSAATELAVKSIIEEINYARRQVLRWIYREYRAVAEVVGFDRIPKVRFDDMALRDEIKMMSIIQGLIDRRVISYTTGQKKLGFDPDTEIALMKEERQLVQDGILGIVGSPFQQSGRQSNQGTPRGTPSEGRPRGRPAPTPKDQDDPDNVGDVTTASVKEVEDKISSLSIEELEALLEMVKEKKSSELKSQAKTRKTSTRKKRQPRNKKQ